MSTPVPAAPTNLPELTYHHHALHAATAANLNSFSGAYKPTPTQAERLTAMFNKNYPDTSRLANICDSGLTKQFAILVEPTSSEDPSNATLLAVLSCPFPSVISTTNEAVFAGTLGDRMDIIVCPVTIRMRDVRGSVSTVSPTDIMPTKLNLAVSSSNPITEEGPPLDDRSEADQPGPDRVHINVGDPDDKPCCIRIPKLFPLSGGCSIPTSDQPIKTLLTTSLQPLIIASPQTQSAIYKTRIQGATKIIQQELADEDKTKTAAKATALYHYGHMGNINDLHKLIGNFYCLLHTIIIVDPTTYPTIWLEITFFNQILQSTEGRKWFELHYHVKEVLLNMVQEIQSTIAGFVSVARKQGYKTALTKNTANLGRNFQSIPTTRSRALL
jgi:hypothetical protein